MIESWVANNPYSTFTLAAYLVAALVFLKDKVFLLCLGSFALVLMLPKITWSGVDVIKIHICYAVLYMFLCILLYWLENHLPALAAAIMALFCSIYATDAWVNSNVETWIFINYSYIVIALHFIIMLSFSRKLSAMVGVGCHFISGVFDTSKPFLPNSHSPSRRALNEEDTQ